VADIELRYLAARAAIADEGTFARAAGRLGYTQSTVSQQIAALVKAATGEPEIGRALLDGVCGSCGR